MFSIDGMHMWNFWFSKSTSGSLRKILNECRKPWFRDKSITVWPIFKIPMEYVHKRKHFYLKGFVHKINFRFALNNSKWPPKTGVIRMTRDFMDWFSNFEWDIFTKDSRRIFPVQDITGTSSVLKVCMRIYYQMLMSGVYGHVQLKCRLKMRT